VSRVTINGFTTFTTESRAALGFFSAVAAVSALNVFRRVTFF